LKAIKIEDETKQRLIYMKELILQKSFDEIVEELIDVWYEHKEFYKI